MSGQEFDQAALVRVFNNTDLGVVRAAIQEAGLGAGPRMGAAVSVLEELDDEIRLLRRYRVAQANSSREAEEAIPPITAAVGDVLKALGDVFIDPLGFPGRIRRAVARIRIHVEVIRQAGARNSKATRLAEAKLDELIETRGKIALLLA